MANGSEKKLEIISLGIQNLRGFQETIARLEQDVLFFVGPNNAGKTSLLRLMDVIFNWKLGDEFTRLSDDLLDELMPARETRNAARRLTLSIRVADGRRRRSLPCDSDGVVELRLSLTINDRRLRANLGVPRRNEHHDEKAEKLLNELRAEYAFAHIPAGRSVDSDRFNDTLLQAMTESLAGTLLQPGKGATAAERGAQKVVESLGKLAGPVEEFWAAFLGRLPSGWVDGGATSSQIDRTVLSRFIVEQLVAQLTTGPHDVAGVPAAEVGSGLQSLLDLELQRFVADASGKKLIIAVEEPEVFLHPSAQRQLGRSLASGALGTMTLVSTHSALVVEEARFDQLAVVRDHVVCQPVSADDTRRSINSALLAGRGAEMIFARSVLLVEGPGDREYFEALRRRLAPIDPHGSVDHCYVLEVGANTNFAPVIRLLNSFHGAPFLWTALMDGDSAKQLREAVGHASLKLSPRQDSCIREISEAVTANDLQACAAKARELASFSDDLPVFLAPGDLESVMCASLDDDAAHLLCGALGLEPMTAMQLAERLGTKHRSGGKAVDSAKKSPWMRGIIGRETPADQVDPFALGVTERWISGASSTSAAKHLLKDFVSIPTG